MAVKILKKNFIETLELTFNASYISAKSTDRKGGWGVWEGCREFLQNAKDADDIGNPMWVTYTNGKAGGKGGKLHIVSKGVTFGREMLILGGGTKQGDDRQRGQFCEGFKLASAVLVDHDCPVTIENGDEIWVPRLGTSDRFGGAEILLVDVYKNPEPQNQYHVVIDHLGRSDYALVKARCLFLGKQKKNDSIEFGRKRILTGDKYVGSLFCRGLYVGDLPEKTAYGYDLPVELDRDRKMADPWSLKWEICDVLKRAVNSGKIPVADFMRMLGSNDTLESTVFATFDGYGHEKFYEKVAEAFISEHGENAVPVTEMSESAEAKHHGLKGVVVSPAIRKVVEVKTGAFETRKTEAAADIARRLSADDLTDVELENLEWALSLLKGTHVEAYRVNVVEFVGENVLGQWSGAEMEIRLAKRIMLDKKEVISTLVHEAAHHGGLADGSIEHRDACDSLFADIILELAG